MAVQLFAAADNGAGLPTQATSSTKTTATNTSVTLTVTNTTGFAVGQGVQMGTSGSTQEYGIITAVVAGTSITVQFLGSGGALFTHTQPYTVLGFTMLQQSELYPVAYLAAATEIFRVKIPAAPPTLIPKFYKLGYFVTGANMTAGGIVSGIVLDREGLGPNLGYQSGIPSNTYKYM